MLAFYSSFAGLLIWYTQSKYFPKGLFPDILKGNKAYVTAALLLLSAILFVSDYGWIRGSIICTFSYILILCLLQLFAVTGKRYFMLLISLVHLLTIGILILHFIQS